MSSLNPTLIGQVISVMGSIVRVKIRKDTSSLILIAGESYRVGQIGGFVKIPMGYSNLYAVCTQVGAGITPSSAPSMLTAQILESHITEIIDGQKWMTAVLFGEALGGKFQRGVGEYPTVGDEVHLVTSGDLELIYDHHDDTEDVLSVGTVASSTGIPGCLNVAGLVSRHSVVVGSTGSGKSNLVTVLLESIVNGSFPNARVIVIDPHGEYATALGDNARVFRIRPNDSHSEHPLRIPFWALPFSELQQILLGELQSNVESAIREEVLGMKISAREHLDPQPPLESLTADSPIPFSIKKLWFELDRFERTTFKKSGQGQDANSACSPLEHGDPQTLVRAKYPPATPHNDPPYKNQKKRNIERKLDLMLSRLKDSRYSFLLTPGPELEPDLDGRTQIDLDQVVHSWVGHDRCVSVFDVSDVPSEVMSEVTGTMLRVIYETLYWAQDLSIGGREQPLLVVIDEAHLFVRQDGDSSAHRTLSMIAKEGRKYGVGLMLVTQRPSEVDSAILSQVGSFVALRLTNPTDRGSVASAVPDDLGGLVELLPSLRTGEGIFIGEVMPIPTRVRVREAARKPEGNDPDLPSVWRTERQTCVNLYTEALRNWRSQSTRAASTITEGDKGDD